MSVCEAFAVVLQPLLPHGVLQYLPIDHPSRHPAVLHVKYRLHIGGAVPGEALVGPA
jgi:hypothetical protein